MQDTESLLVFGARVPHIVVRCSFALRSTFYTGIDEAVRDGILLHAATLSSVVFYHNRAIMALNPAVDSYLRCHSKEHNFFYWRSGQD